jgi:hypothetical protein
MSMIGDNTQTIDYAREEIDRLASEYNHLSVKADELLSEAFLQIEAGIDDQDAKSKVASLIKRLRDADKQVEAIRELEKMPHYRRGQGVDQFFNGLRDKLFKREKRGRDGGGDQLQTMLTEYDTQLLREEQERRRKEAEAAQREWQRKEAELREAARVAQEKAEAAERARKAETQAAKTAAADEASRIAADARIAAEASAEKAEAAHVATLSRPADIMRQRGQDGTLTTMAREYYAEIEDAHLLDAEVLWPFVPIDAKEKALRAWAKTTGHRTQMPGAAIGSRPKSVVR